MWYSERRNKIVMSVIKKILLSILVVFIAIQFIQSGRNKAVMVLPTDISKMVNIPYSVQVVLKNACYDCHSNNTEYPWYVNIQPAGWLMAKHIRQGKEELNFSEFGNYTARKQLSKFTGIANSIKDGAMPLWSYKWMHKNAKLTDEESTLIINWVQNSKDSLAAKN